MKKTANKKVPVEDDGAASVLRSLFRSFAMLAERAADGRPLLRGLRVGHDPKGDRFVAVHLSARVEFVLRIEGDDVPQAQVECRPMDSAGATAEVTIARFQFNEAGTVFESTVPELVGERLDQNTGAWSIVAAVLWDALHAGV